MSKIHKYKNWEIEGVGGFCTVRHFWATKNDRSFWDFKLKDAKHWIDLMESGLEFSELPKLHRQSLYI